MDYYGFGWPSEEQRREHEEWKEKSKEGIRRYWANITPEQREERKRKAAETRRRNAEQLRQRWIEEAERRERRAEGARKAAATRRRNRGLPDLSEMNEWQREAQLLKERRDYKQREKEEQYGPRKEPERRKVPGGGRVLYEFPGVDPERLWKRNQKFWAYADQSGGPDACWPWHGRYFEDRVKGGLSKYGAFYWDRSGYIGAHRAAWILVNGLHIPYPLVVDHMCVTPWCVNATPGVGHLEVVTVAENNRRKFHREPEITRQSTSPEPPWNDRWYPFGRLKYDDNGELKEKYRNQEVNEEEVPPLPAYFPRYPSRRKTHLRNPRFSGYVDEPPLLEDDEEL